MSKISAFGYTDLFGENTLFTVYFTFLPGRKEVLYKYQMIIIKIILVKFL